MSYDPYNDPYNPVTKSKKPDMGSDPGYHVGDGGMDNRQSPPPRTDFEYGSGGRDIAINTPDDGVCEGTTEASQAVANWDKDGDGNKATAPDYEDGPYEGTAT